MIEQPIKKQPVMTLPKPPFAVTEHEIGDFAIRRLGPIPFWGGEIIIKKTAADHFKEALAIAAKEQGFRYSGYFTDHNAQSIFHISRLPRRVGIGVPTVSEHQEHLTALSKIMRRMNIAHEIREEKLQSASCIRAIFGLQEGYYESRRKQLLTSIESGMVTSIDGVIENAEKLGLEFSRFGINTGDYIHLCDLTDTLKKVTFAIEHTPGEARRILPTTYTLTPIEIYAASPDSIYTEPAVRVEGALTPHTLAELVQLGDTFHQARFSFESLDQFEASNIEILNFSSNKSASIA